MPEVHIHTTADGHVFGLGARVRPPDPVEWSYRLFASAVDRSKSRSLAQFFPEVMDQGPEGSCTAFSSVAVQQACGAIGGSTPVPLSAQDLYYLERVKEGSFPQDAGAYTADSFDCVLQNGGLPSALAWPYDAQPAERPPADLTSAPRYLYISGHQPIAGAQFIDGILTALDAHKPLVLAFNFYASFYADYQQTGVLQPPSGQLMGGHQIAVKGWVPGPQLVWCQNSWGATSPDRTDLVSGAKSGDIFLSAGLFSDGVVSEIRAAVPAVVPVPPGPQPTPGGSIKFSDYTWTGAPNG